MIETTVQPSHEPHTKGKEQAPITLENTSGKKREQQQPKKKQILEKEGGGWGEKMTEKTSWAEKNQHKGKLNAPMKHMIDVRATWHVHVKTPLTSGT